MRTLPFVLWMPRVSGDLQNCINFVAQSPMGNPVKREKEIRAALASIYRAPKANRVQLRRPNLDLRTRSVAQFFIIYACFEPNDVMLNGLVSIRAIRHRRVRDLFKGVKERVAAYDNVGPAAKPQYPESADTRHTCR